MMKKKKFWLFPSAGCEEDLLSREPCGRAAGLMNEPVSGAGAHFTIAK
jgi:hypothetical protein